MKRTTPEEREQSLPSGAETVDAAAGRFLREKTSGRRKRRQVLKKKSGPPAKHYREEEKVT